MNTDNKEWKRPTDIIDFVIAGLKKRNLKEEQCISWTFPSRPGVTKTTRFTAEDDVHNIHKFELAITRCATKKEAYTMEFRAVK